MTSEMSLAGFEAGGEQWGRVLGVGSGQSTCIDLGRKLVGRGHMSPWQRTCAGSGIDCMGKGFLADLCPPASPHTLVRPVSCLKVHLIDLSCGLGKGEPGVQLSLLPHEHSQGEPRSRSFYN